MIVGPINPRPSEFAIGGASTRAISSQKRDCSISVALRPPYSFGHETAAHPPSYNLRCHARRYENDSSSGFSRHSFQSFGTLASSHARNSSRNFVSSVVRFRSIRMSFYGYHGDHQLGGNRSSAISKPWASPWQLAGEEFPGPASISCATLFSVFSQCPSWEVSRKIQSSAAPCSVRCENGRIRAAQ